MFCSCCNLGTPSKAHLRLKRSIESQFFCNDAICDGDNEQVGLPSIAKRFRGKPLLVYGKESSVVRGPGFVELDLNAHAFSYVGRKVNLGKLLSSFMVLQYTGVYTLGYMTIDMLLVLIEAHAVL